MCAHLTVCGAWVLRILRHTSTRIARPARRACHWKAAGAVSVFARQTYTEVANCDRYSFIAISGSLTTNFDPTPSSLSQIIVPLCASTI